MNNNRLDKRNIENDDISCKSIHSSGINSNSSSHGNNSFYSSNSSCNNGENKNASLNPSMGNSKINNYFERVDNIRKTSEDETINRLFFNKYNKMVVNDVLHGVVDDNDLVMLRMALTINPDSQLLLKWKKYFEQISCEGVKEDAIGFEDKNNKASQNTNKRSSNKYGIIVNINCIYLLNCS